MDLIDLMTTHVVPVDNRALDFNVEYLTTLLAKKMVMGHCHAIVAKFSTSDSHGRDKVFFNEGIQGIIYCGHRHRRYSLDECFVYHVDSGVYFNVTVKIFEDLEPLIRWLESSVLEGSF